MSSTGFHGMIGVYVLVPTH